MEANRSGSPVPIGALIVRHMPPAMQTAMRLADMERDWPNLVGAHLAALTRPASMDRDGLLVLCETPAAAHMMTLSAGTLTRRTQQRWGLHLSAVRAIVAPLNRRRSSERKEPRILHPDPAAVQQYYKQVRSVIDRDDVALALARLEALYKARFGNK